MKKVAKIILINSKKEFLLYLRDNKSSIPYPNHWDFIGGLIEENEIPLNALIREIKEEIPDCKVTNIKHIGNLNLKFRNEIMIFFKGNIEDSIEFINKKLTEGQKAKYFKLNELSKIKLTQFDRNFIFQNVDKI